MKLSIVTINYNDAAGLQKTLESVASQATGDKLQAIGLELEHIIIDGGSTDESVDVIKDYVLKIKDCRLQIDVRWISEKDKGIYNAMNKGIKMATGDYCQFLNSGDMLADEYVVQKMYQGLKEKECPDIFYGGMIKSQADGKKLTDFSGGGTEYTLMQAYHGCLNHSPAYIKRSLFDKYGLYDETLRICSDWKWYLQAIVLGGTKAVYVPIDVTIFDMGGISETRKDILEEERTRLLKELVPPGILHDYDNHYFDMVQMDTLRKHPWAYKLVWILERVLNRIDNKNFKRRKK